MRIGELEKQSGCDTETIRFYEREGLLSSPLRETNGYRNYTESHLVQLNFIRHCRSLGIGLPDVRILRSFQASPELACDGINELIEQQIARIHQQVEIAAIAVAPMQGGAEHARVRGTVAGCGLAYGGSQGIKGFGRAHERLRRIQWQYQNTPPERKKTGARLTPRPAPACPPPARAGGCRRRASRPRRPGRRCR